jgi:hypothetical protein
MATTPESSPRRVSWIRWLRHHGLPRDHILFVLELDDCSEFDRWLNRGSRQGPPPVRPKPKCRYHAGSVRQVNAGIRGTGSNKLRRMTELGYPPVRIAHLLGVPVATVRRYQRKGSAERPPPLSPWYAPGDGRRTADPFSPAPAIAPPAVELVNDQVDQVEDVPTIKAPPAAVWIGPHSPQATKKKRKPPLPCPDA